MLLQDFIPSLAVREFVRYYRIVHFEFDRSITIPFKAYPPKPEQCLHFFLREPFAIETTGNSKSNQPSIVFSGQRTALVKQYNGPSFLDVQIVFQPTAFFRLTGIPAYELTNQHCDATSIFPKNIQFTFEQLQLSKSYAEILTILETFSQNLVSQVPKESVLMDGVSRQMVQYSGNISIDWLAQESCLCTKQFERKFNQRTGVNPKTYLKIIRFNRAYNLRNQFPNKDWLSIAIESGYCDYQHLTKDYKYFTGLTPPDLHLLESNSPESLLGLTTSIYQSRIKETF
jgi:AraC-like DNA-binding protein